MELQIRDNGTRVTDEMHDLVNRKLEMVDKLVNNVVEAQLELRTENPRSGISETTAQVTIRTRRHVLRAEVRDTEPAKAIAEAMDKLVTQARKVNDKRARNRRRTTGVSEVFANSVPPLAEDQLETSSPLPGDDEVLAEDGFENEQDVIEDRVVRIKRFHMKPMQIDEAIDQLELVGHDFFLFLNADEDQLNVLYRRRDGDYGLLLPS